MVNVKFFLLVFYLSGWSVGIARCGRIGFCWRTCCEIWLRIILVGCAGVGAFDVTDSPGLGFRLGLILLALQG